MRIVTIVAPSYNKAAFIEEALGEEALGWALGDRTDAFRYFPPCAVLWPRALYERSGGLDERLQILQGPDVMGRMLLRGTALELSTDSQERAACTRRPVVVSIPRSRIPEPATHDSDRLCGRSVL